MTAGSVNINSIVLEVENIDIHKVTAPLQPQMAWEVESLLVSIFEFGDYSFRSALTGEYSEKLNCTFFLAKRKDNIVGVAACLYAHKNPSVAVVGPVGILPEYQHRGIGTKLVASLINHLKSAGCMAAYLSVSEKNPAVNLYQKLGFKKYKGIVMRLLLNDKFEQHYFSSHPDIKIRRTGWGDFPAILALASFPGGIYTYDFRRSIFSSRYVKPARFLSIFPEMMKDFAKYGGFANVLTSKKEENVVGIAHIRRLPGKARRHIAELDFYTHDNFIERAKTLVQQTIEESDSLFISGINCYCLACDDNKREILIGLSFRQIAVLPENVCIKGNYYDVLIYHLSFAKGGGIA
jgi:GNAT superfamily N-acetyltransferase